MDDKGMCGKSRLSPSDAESQSLSLFNLFLPAIDMAPGTFLVLAVAGSGLASLHIFGPH